MSCQLAWSGFELDKQVVVPCLFDIPHVRTVVPPLNITLGSASIQTFGDSSSSDGSHAGPIQPLQPGPTQPLQPGPVHPGSQVPPSSVESQHPESAESMKPSPSLSIPSEHCGGMQTPPSSTSPSQSLSAPSQTSFSGVQVFVEVGS